MSDSPFYSVIIPVYNSEKYLNDCIQSIVNQTFEDFEIVLVDDESTDSSPQICDAWASRYPSQVRVIHQSNTGTYIAKRNGIKASRGQYLYVIDNDDLIISTHMFEEIHQTLANSNADLVIFNAIDNVETGHYLTNIPFENEQVFEGESLSTIYDHYLGTKNLHHIWMMIFRRTLFDWDYEYDAPFRMLRDGPFLVLPLISNATKIIYLEKAYYYWRIQNLSSASKHYDALGFYESVRLLHERVAEFSNKWLYTTDKTPDLLRKNILTDYCITAMKVRGVAPDADINRRELLKLIANDELFRSNYSLKLLDNLYKPIAFLLYHKCYFILDLSSSLIGKAKGR